MPKNVPATDRAAATNEVGRIFLQPPRVGETKRPLITPKVPLVSRYPPASAFFFPATDADPAGAPSDSFRARISVGPLTATRQAVEFRKDSASVSPLAELHLRSRRRARTQPSTARRSRRPPRGFAGAEVIFLAKFRVPPAGPRFRRKRDSFSLSAYPRFPFRSRRNRSQTLNLRCRRR